ncbi:MULTISPECIES: hypothetical protein [unclassified Acidovorax]|uniref:hypothetical protein n=1 Tax=unclassified Acidovorax TaxID=2684926 RepID=UPI0028831F3B|nr:MULTISPECIES: hypothetical protein [unclassified Acidovorax]
MPNTPREHANDEPEITQENDVPLDGTDPVGEDMMKEVRNDRLKVPPGEEEQADQARQ